MKKANFDMLKNLPVPEDWIENALAIPERENKKKAVIQFRRNRSLIAAASLMLVSTLSFLLYLSFGFRTPVEIKRSVPATEIVWSTDENGATVATEVVAVSGDTAQNGRQSTETQTVIEQLFGRIFGTGSTSTTTESVSHSGGGSDSRNGTGHASDEDASGGGGTDPTAKTDPTTITDPGEGGKTDPTMKPDPGEGGKPDPTTTTTPTEGGKTEPSTKPDPTEAGNPSADPTSAPTEAPWNQPTEAGWELPTVQPWSPPTEAPTEGAGESPTEPAARPPRRRFLYVSIPQASVPSDGTVYCKLQARDGEILGKYETYAEGRRMILLASGAKFTYYYTISDYITIPYELEGTTAAYYVYDGAGNILMSGSYQL